MDMTPSSGLAIGHSARTTIRSTHTPCLSMGQMFLFLTPRKLVLTWQQFRTPARKNPTAENQVLLV